MTLITRAKDARIGAWIGAGLALFAVLAVYVPERFGTASPFSLAIAAALGLSATIILLAWAPATLAAAVPLLIPIPLTFHVFAIEVLLGYALILVLIHGYAHRRPWLTHLTRIEAWALLFFGWALFTGFWVSDGMRYLAGVRRLGIGVAALWVAYRLAHVVPRRTFLLGIVAGAGTIAFATLAKRISTGFSAERALISRGTATDLGWGWANYIAAILIVMTPFVLVVAMRARAWGERAFAVAVFGLIVSVQLIIVARGALLLFATGILYQLTASNPRRRLVGLLFGAAVIGGLLLGPWGAAILLRFTSLRELSSGTIRLWYWREAWIRTVDNLPWGIGLEQRWIYADKLQGLDPHDYWLDLSSELGFLGPPLWFALLFVIGRMVRRVVRTPALGAEGVALETSFYASQIHTLVEPTFQGSQYQFIFFWIIGAYAGYLDQATSAAVSIVPAPIAAVLKPAIAKE